MDSGAWPLGFWLVGYSHVCGIRTLLRSPITADTSWIKSETLVMRSHAAGCGSRRGLVQLLTSDRGRGTVWFARSTLPISVRG